MSHYSMNNVLCFTTACVNDDVHLDFSHWVAPNLDAATLSRIHSNLEQYVKQVDDQKIAYNKDLLRKNLYKPFLDRVVKDDERLVDFGV